MAATPQPTDWTSFVSSKMKEGSASGVKVKPQERMKQISEEWRAFPKELKLKGTCKRKAVIPEHTIELLQAATKKREVSDHDAKAVKQQKQDGTVEADSGVDEPADGEGVVVVMEQASKPKRQRRPNEMASFVSNLISQHSAGDDGARGKSIEIKPTKQTQRVFERALVEVQGAMTSAKITPLQALQLSAAIPFVLLSGRPGDNQATHSALQTLADTTSPTS